jgi:NAD(P)-dependent dehydrogenase (short-subunit alcohol dehydrogenase family)
VSELPSALVVGGSGAVGTAICDQLICLGLTVYATRTTDGSQQHVRWLRWSAGEPFTPGQALGNADLRALFYCVGIPSSKTRLLETALDEVTQSFAINATAMLSVLTNLRSTIRRSGTCVIAISSDATTSTRALNGPYTASKLALEAFCRTIAIEEQEHKVRANVLCPSLIESSMGDASLLRSGVTDLAAHKVALPGGRALSPAEVARAAISIAFDSQWQLCSGQVFRLGAPPR